LLKFPRPAARRFKPERVPPLDIGSLRLPRSRQARPPSQRSTGAVVVPAVHAAASAPPDWRLLTEPTASGPRPTKQSHAVRYPCRLRMSNTKIVPRIRNYCPFTTEHAGTI